MTERTVRNYLKTPPGRKSRKKLSSKLDAYRDYIGTIIEDNPHCNIELLYKQLVAARYRGKISILQDYAATVRKRLPRETVIGFETLPGQQAQVYWKKFSKQVVGGRRMKLYAFVMILGYSRMPYVQYTSVMKTYSVRACPLCQDRCRLKYLGDGYEIHKKDQGIGIRRINLSRWDSKVLSEQGDT